MSFIKSLYAKYLFHRGLSAVKLGEVKLAVNLIERSSYILLEMIQAGEDKYESHYARTEMNLGVLYNKLGAVNESLHSFLLAIRKFNVLVFKGRLDIVDELTKAESVFNTLYPGAIIDLERGVITGSQTPETSTMELLTASLQGDIHRLTIALTSNGPDVRDQNNVTPLMYAAKGGHTEILKLLLDSGADPNAKDVYMATPLIWGALTGLPAVAEILIAAGAEVNSCDKHGCSSLMYAAERNHLGYAKTLIDGGADAGLKDDKGLPAVGYAFCKGHVDMAMLLSGAGQRLSGMSDKDLLNEMYKLHSRVSVRIGALMDSTQPNERSLHEKVEGLLLQLDRMEFPATWAMLQNHLAVLLQESRDGYLSDNLERSIAACRVALEIRTRNKSPVKWAETTNNLGEALRDRIEGDPAANIENSILAFMSALEVFCKNQHLVEWAMVTNNLGTAYCRRIVGDRVVNMDNAIQFFKSTLKVFNRTDHPTQWARAYGNLAEAHRLKSAFIHGKRREAVLKDAVIFFQKALEEYSKSDTPWEWAMMQNNLGLSFLWLGSSSEENRNSFCDSDAQTSATKQYVADAVRALEAALEIYTREKAPVDFAEVSVNLGIALSQLGRTGVAISTLKMARECADALHYVNCARVAGGILGCLYFEKGDYELAHDALKGAIAAAENVRLSSSNFLSKIRWATDNDIFYDYIIHACLRVAVPKTIEAFEYLEAGKTRSFLDDLGFVDLPSPCLSPLYKDLLHEERELVSKNRKLNNALYACYAGKKIESRAQILEKAHDYRKRLEEIWNKLADDPSCSSYVTVRRGKTMTFSDARCLVRGRNRTALIEYRTGPKGTLIFVVKPDLHAPIVRESPLTVKKLTSFVGRLHRDLQKIRPSKPNGMDFGYLEMLSKELLHGVLNEVKDCDTICFVPHGPIHQLPLHALLTEDGRPVAYKFASFYAPSASILHICQKGETCSSVTSTSQYGQNLVFGAPKIEDKNLLIVEEASVISKLLGTDRTILKLNTDASKRFFMENCRNKKIVYVSCHGYFDGETPLNSGLVLSNGKQLPSRETQKTDEYFISVREILETQISADLIVLSACVSGRSAVSGGDELYGLPRAFLVAGTRSVIGSLWNVNVASCKEFMKSFFEAWNSGEGTSKAHALQIAQKNMMGSINEPWQHFFHWAPYILIGN